MTPATAAALHPTQRRILTVLVAAQILSGAGLAAGITVGALLAEDMLDTTGLSGLPSTLFTAGSAVAAALIGRTSQRRGRRTGLAAGYAAGALGALGVVVAATIDNVTLLFTALVIYGAGTATNLQARYSGADLATPGHRARALSTVLVATTLGAVVGPNLVTPLGTLARSWNIPPLAGPFLLAAIAYGAAAVVLWTLLRPDPLLTARTLAEPDTPRPGHSPATPSSSGDNRRLVLLGAAVMVVAQLVMVAIMTMTPIHMQHHGHSVGAAGAVIAVHIASMYLPSPLSGFLVDRYGRIPIAGASGLTLMAAGLVAAFAPPQSVALLAIALGLLGLGWSLGLVSGTAIITDNTSLATRAKTQGLVDVTIAVAGAGGGLASGMIVATGSYTLLSLVGGIIAVALLPVLVIATRAGNRVRPHDQPAPTPADR
ncbi:Predicted arabinose efflux permease, MFS family [Actinopolyspora xinjiangensis]|uniref:Predicted arabinose efflux permease, MFS family n=1 Tax=Actinopolyspora xinjiangensis TaxID=405564 RepID=A0A1H0RGY8_9ACTN|nr:MFS transporter [Actinopolyspora xinjiangensis]SDP28660.1 Predicted arabinose efflux permease, MFS family [Actinopolyspora xinjiangensis]